MRLLNHGYSRVIIVSYGLWVVNQYFMRALDERTAASSAGSRKAHPFCSKRECDTLAEDRNQKGPTSRNEREKWGTPSLSFRQH